jgi:hypothetical protein
MRSRIFEFPFRVRSTIIRRRSGQSRERRLLPWPNEGVRATREYETDVERERRMRRGDAAARSCSACLVLIGVGVDSPS